MANFKLFRSFAVGLLILLPSPRPADAQQPVQGFAVERFYPSAPGAGWFVMDDLNISGALGGAISLTTGYSRNPLEIPNPGSQPLALVSNEAFADVGLAATWHRFRVYLNLPVPLVVNGNNGTVGLSHLTAPAVNLGTNPDTISDSRVGFDVRMFGNPNGPFRLGAGAQLIIPSGIRTDYVTDGRYRTMFRLLAAGDAGHYSYAGQLGVHIRPVEGSLPPGGPAGNEILFGAAAGRRLLDRNGWAVIAGPEFFGETAVHSFFNNQTGFEGLLTGRLERTGDRPHLRLRLGIGHALVQEFGVPEWRMLIGVELLGQRTAH